MKKQLLYQALLKHDDHTLMPEWSLERRNELSLALDELRGLLTGDCAGCEHGGDLKIECLCPAMTACPGMDKEA